MEKLLIKYFRNANSYRSIDPTCFDLKEFTETWLIENKAAINYTHCCETFKEDRKEDVENSAYGNWFDHQRYS